MPILAPEPDASGRPKTRPSGRSTEKQPSAARLGDGLVGGNGEGDDAPHLEERCGLRNEPSGPRRHPRERVAWRGSSRPTCGRSPRPRRRCTRAPSRRIAAQRRQRGRPCGRRRGRGRRRSRRRQDRGRLRSPPRARSEGAMSALSSEATGRLRPPCSVGTPSVRVEPARGGDEGRGLPRGSSGPTRGTRGRRGRSRPDAGRRVGSCGSRRATSRGHDPGSNCSMPTTSSPRCASSKAVADPWIPRPRTTTS